MTIPEKIDSYENRFNKFEIDYIDGKFVLGILGRNKYFSISKENFFDITKENSIIKGAITQKLIMVELSDGSFYFANNLNEKYKVAFKNSKITIKSLELGEKVILQSGNNGFYIGSFYSCSFYSSILYKIKRNYLVSENGGLMEFSSKDIYSIDGFDNKYSDINHNMKKYLSSRHSDYCITMSDVRALAKANGDLEII